jgi:glucan 1,3-beta-glucosidase
MVLDTVYVPPNAKIVGEALASIIMGTGQKFGDIKNPRPIVQVGRPGDAGQIEWSDTIISTRGATAGAVLIEYNLYSPGTPSGMWDVHTRIGGFAGTYLQVPECPAIKGTNIINPRCLAAYISFHVTTYAGGLLTENCWFWVADHDLENQKYARVSLVAGRGVLVEAQRGRIWLSATGSEHHVLYQYQFVNTKDVYIGHVQTEQAYFQPMPLAQYPFPPVPALHDPDFEQDCQGDSDPRCNMGWAMRIIDSSNIATYGAGL